MIISKLREYGLRVFLNKLINKIKRDSGYIAWRFHDVEKYQSPTDDELLQIEYEMRAAGLVLEDYEPSKKSFEDYKKQAWFPDDYHGGKHGKVWDEKVLEHWLASELLGLMEYASEDIYVDVAAGGSPWVKALRDRKGIQAYAIDLGIKKDYENLDYYREEDATASSFSDASVRGASLQCAFEMFVKGHDAGLIKEIKRILKPGGKVVILPLYMHTHYCAYSTSEYFGKGYPDQGAKEYVRLDCNGIPSSRKYNVEKLQERVLDIIENEGMQYRLLRLNNKNELGRNIYCHFILEITR